jgi:HK97 family phage portal protein
LSLIRSVAEFTGIRAAGGAPNPADDFWYSGISAGAVAASGVKVNPDSAMRSSAVYACVNAISRSVAALPLKLYRELDKGGKEVATEHPLYDKLYWQPNPWQTAFDFKLMGQVHFELRGNFFVELIPDPSNPIFPLMLVPLHPDRVRVWRMPSPGGGWVPDYQYIDPVLRTTRWIAQENMFHLRNLAGGDGLIGYTPVEVFAETVGAAIAAQDYGARFFANDGKPSTYITGAEFRNDDDREKFRDSWQKSQTGANRHKTAVLPKGMELKELGMKNAEAQFIESRKFARDEIAGIYGVPLHIIGATERVASYASVEQFNIQFAVQCIMPRLVAWEQAIQRDLLAEGNEFSGDRYFAKFVMAALLRGDMLSRYNAYKVGREGGWLSPNDIREFEDMNPIDGGDEYVRPMNMTPLGSDPNQQQTTATPTQDDNGPLDGDTSAKGDHRLKLLAVSAADRCVRKEIAAVRKDLLTANGDFNSKTADFYRQHRGFMSEVLLGDGAKIAAYCIRHHEDLLRARGAGEEELLLSKWEAGAPSELAAIAAGGKQ